MLYKAKGYVLGNLWGGGQGFYPTTPITDDVSIGNLKKKAKMMLKTGDLDSGMGFESLEGALLYVECIDTKLIKGKEYNRSEWKELVIGSLTQSNLERARELYEND